MLASALVLGLLSIYGPQAVLSFKTITFSSVTQCGSFNVSFVGGQAPSAMPLTLTVVPFNSTIPVSIPIARDAWDAETSTGAVVTFLPFVAGMTFIASLDDALGIGTGPVSDVIKVQPSDNSSCLPAEGDTTNSTMSYTLNGTLSQCLPFNVSYNPTTENAPTVRAFTPKGPSVFVNSTSESSGVATFVMNDHRDEAVVLLFDDGHGNRQATDLITVGGDTSSSTDCIHNQKMSKGSSSDATATQHGLSKGSITGIVAGSVTVVGVISILMVLYVCRERRRRFGNVRNFNSLESQGGGGDGEIPQMTANLSTSSASQPRVSAAIPAVSIPPPSSTRFLRRNTNFSTVDVSPLPLTSPEFIDYRDRGDERSSWIQPDPRWRSAVAEPALDPVATTRSVEDHRELAVSPRLSNDQRELDIDEILEMATMYSLSPSTDNPTTQPFTPATVSSHDHYHAPSDVPVGAERMSMFYASSVGSQLYTTTQMQSIFGEGVGRHVPVDTSARSARESTTASPALDPIPPVEIAIATRAGTAVARVALMDS